MAVVFIVVAFVHGQLFPFVSCRLRTGARGQPVVVLVLVVVLMLMVVVVVDMVTCWLDGCHIAHGDVAPAFSVRERRGRGDGKTYLTLQTVMMA